MRVIQIIEQGSQNNSWTAAGGPAKTRSRTGSSAAVRHLSKHANLAMPGNIPFHSCVHLTQKSTWRRRFSKDENLTMSGDIRR
jgi:hypothetical protein